MKEKNNLISKEEIDIYKKQVGANIKALREKAGLSQEQLSEKIGIHSSTLGGIETGKSQPQVATLLGLAKVLDVDIYQIFIMNTADLNIKEKHDKTLKQELERFKNNQKAVEALNYFLENFK